MKKIAFASCFIPLLASGASAIAAEVGICNIQVSGDATMSTEMSQTDRSMNEDPSRRVIAMAATDYWRSDALIRNILKTLAEVTSSFGNKDKATKAAEVERTVNEKMKKDPRVHILTINCMNSAVNLNLEPRDGSKYANVPFKANRYAIAPMASAKPGDFSAGVYLKEGGHSSLFAVSGAGQIDITKFDAQGVQGKFSFPARQSIGGSRKITVNGTFSFKCTGADRCKP